MTKTNFPAELAAPVRGLNADSAVMSMRKTDALVLENFLPYPDRLQMRTGAADHVTGSAANVDRLHPYSSPSGVNTLWATTDSGVYNVTSAGALPAASIALTDGKTIGAILSTGASNYLTLCNGVDTVKQYDGTTWSSIATFGATATSEYSYIETYRQRYYLIRKNSMSLEYLGANAVSGATTSYNLGSIFRRGGYLVALGTWTIDGGTGPDDHLVIVTSQGEIAVFTGTDPASVNTWSYKGTYYIGRPLGQRPLYKYGGDLLYLCENGLYPLSKALLNASIDRTQAISSRIDQLFADAGVLYFTAEGWDIVSVPDIPMVLVNVPSSPVKTQFCMHSQTGAWTIFSGWSPFCFARLGATLYFGTATGVSKMTGASDYGAQITATMLQAFLKFSSRNSKIEEIRAVFEANGTFNYTLGIASDFQSVGQTTQVAGSTFGSAAVWGTGTWGSAVWTSAQATTRDWRAVPDVYSIWKAVYLQVSSNTAVVQYLGCDLLAKEGSSF